MRTTLALLLALGACRSDKTSATPSQPAQQSDDATDAEVIRIGDEARTTTPRSYGVPHAGNIDRIALSTDGAAALTRDHLGSVRLWRSLDGTEQPLLVPLRGASAMSLARREDGGFTLALIDAARSAHILTVDAEGAMTERGVTAPHEPMRQVDVLPGGEHIVLLSADRSILLVDTGARRLATLQERRFRPEALRIHGGGSEILAVIADGVAPDRSLALRTVRIDTERPGLSLEDGEIAVDGAGDTGRDQVALSPDGAALAFLTLKLPTPSAAGQASPEPARQRVPPPPPPGGHQMKVVIVDLDDGSSFEVAVGLPSFERGALGFVSPTQLIATSKPTGGSWLIDLADPDPRPIPSPAANDPSHNATAFAGDLRVSADGTWLFVQRPKSSQHHYLGFRHFDPQSASLSPSGKSVAWVAAGVAFFEELGEGGRTTRLVGQPVEPLNRVALVDDAHALTANHAGGIELVRIRDGRVLASADAGGPFRDLEYDPERGLLRVVRSQGGSALYEVSVDGGITGPHLVFDASFRSGFGAGGTVLWTIDGQNKLRTYRLGELREGISRKAIAERATPITNRAVPMAIDRRGRFYWIDNSKSGTSSVLRIGRVGEQEDAEEVPLAAPVFSLAPSPSADRVAAVANTGNVLTVYDIESGEPLWSFPVGLAIRQMIWSADGTRLAIASQSGGVVLDAESGARVHRTCGPWFEHRQTPPQTTVNFGQQPNLCEQ